MWYEILPRILNMSLTAAVIILFVCICRLLLKKAPKIYSYALWSVVLFRLLCPVSLSAPVSLLGMFHTPVAEVTTPDASVTQEGERVSTGTASAVEYIPFQIVHEEYPEISLPVGGSEGVVAETINQALPQGEEQLGADPLEAPVSLFTYLWILGILVMLGRGVVSYIRLLHQMTGALFLKENIYLADHIPGPFVMGLIRPKIYLPSDLQEKEYSYIILHEKHHIRRGDHIFKVLGYLALSIHWFNPLVWVAFRLFVKDMEMSCDEAVLRKLGEEIRADYSASLLQFAAGQKAVYGTPLAFGEGETKGRIRNLSAWKKPKRIISLVAIVLCVIAILFCFFNPTLVKEALKIEKGEQTETTPEDKDEEKSDTTEVVNRAEGLSQAELEEILSLIEEKKYPQALWELSKVEGDYRSYVLETEIREQMAGDSIANLLVGVAAIYKDGKVIVRVNEEIYESYGYEMTEEWTDIKKLSYATEGLDAVDRNGKFYTTMKGAEEAERNEQLGKLTGIRLFATDWSNYAVTDLNGKLYAYSKYTDFLEAEAVKKEIQSWSNVVDVVTGRDRLVVLHRDGTVSFVYSNKLPDQTVVTNKYAGVYDDIPEWTEIVDIDGDETGNIAALKADGTVLLSNRMQGQGIGEDYSQVSEWTDIIAISKSSQNILALRRDGTVVTAGVLKEGQKEVSQWTDIVAISAGQNFHLGLKADGTLVVAGENEGDRSLPDVSDVSGLYVPTIELNMNYVEEERNKAEEIYAQVLEDYKELSRVIYVSSLKTDTEELTDENGMIYFRVLEEEYQSIEDIEELMASVLTEEYICDYMSWVLGKEKPLFKELDGKLCIAMKDAIGLGIATQIQWIYQFNETHLKFLGYNEDNTYLISLVKQGDRWLINELGIAGNEPTNYGRAPGTVQAYLSMFPQELEEILAEGKAVYMTNYEFTNVPEWERFLECIKKGEAASVVVMQNTDEGDPILYYIHYDGIDFQVVRDTHRDHFGTPTYIWEKYPYMSEIRPEGTIGYRVVFAKEKFTTVEEADAYWEKVYAQYQEGLIDPDAVQEYQPFPLTISTVWEGYTGNSTVAEEKATISGSFTVIVRDVIPDYTLDDTTPTVAVVTSFQSSPFTIYVGEEIGVQLVEGETYVFTIQAFEVAGTKEALQKKTLASIVQEYATKFTVVDFRVAEEHETGVDSLNLIIE